jgi:hypothetical protein
MDRDPDPWKWSTDDVVDEFCKSRSIWAIGRPNVKLPDPVKLESILRDNEVDGASILEIEQEQLKDDLGIKAFGHRDGLLWGIDQLRQRSDKWKERSQSKYLMQPQVFVSNRQTPIASFQVPDMARPVQSPSHPTIRDCSGRSDNLIDSAPGVVAPTSTTGGIADQHLADGKPEVPDLVTGQRRPGETFVFDEGGRKRRRLILGQPNALTAHNTITQSLVESSKPIYFELPSRCVLSGVKSQSRTYLGPTKLTPDDVFFGSGRFGKPINADWDIRPVPENDLDEPAADFELVLRQAAAIPGRQKYVHSRLVKFFKEIPYEHDSAGRTVILSPYPPVPDIAESSRSVILFQTMDGGISATRESATRIEVKDLADYDNGSNPSNHDWDFLDHWRNEKTEEIPVYGESEPNSEWDRCLESIDEEEKADMEQALGKNRILDKNNVIAVIDEEIDHFIQQWTAQKLPLRKNSAWMTWRKPKGSRARRMEAAGARGQIELLSKRLTNLKDSILDEVWYNKKKIRELCGSLQETVCQREEQKFKASLWLQNEAQLKPLAKLHVKKKARVIYDSDPDAIDLSGSDVVDEPDSHDNFIDIDSVQHLDMTMDVDPLEMAYSHHVTLQDKSDDQSQPDDAAGTPTNDSPSNQNTDTPDAHSLVEVESESTLAPLANRPRDQHSPSQARNVIDLTMSDDDSQLFGNNPLEDSAEKVLEWNWDELIERDDRKRLVIKLTRTLPEDYYLTLRKPVTRGRGLDLSSSIESAAENIVRRLDGDDDPWVGLVRLYCCWLDCSPELFKRVRMSGQDGFKAPISEEKAQQVVLICQEERPDVDEFCNFLRAVFELYDKPITTEKIEADLATVDGDSENGKVIESQRTPHKKRKKKIQASQIGVRIRDKALKTRIEHEKRSQVFLTTQSSELAEIDDRIVVNVGKKENEESIYLNHHIGQRIQPHQIEGLRFMWREVVSSSPDEDDMQGCLLAHTMGLGKTMQA